MIFCKFYTEVDPIYAESIIREIGMAQFDIMIDMYDQFKLKINKKWNKLCIWFLNNFCSF